MTPESQLTIDVPASLWQSSNQRLHWADRSRRTKAIRTLAKMKARPLPRHKGKVHVAAFVARPRGGRADVANSYPTVKAALDGCVDAGVLVDDSDQYVIGPDMRTDPSTGTKGLYRVRIVITDQEVQF